MRTRIAFAVIPAVLAALVTPTAAIAANPGDIVPASSLLAELKVAAPVTAGYNENLFEAWIDTDGDGCNTRQGVLIAESEIEPTIVAPCTVTAGQWYSWYDGVTSTSPADVEIDHVVALSEAWKSGAYTWSAAQRRDFANDLTIDETLEAVSATVDDAKGDSDPANWLPPLPETHCEYAIEWSVVKYRWHLTIDNSEQAVLASLLSGECGLISVSLPPRADTTDPQPPSVADDRLVAGQTLGSGVDLLSSSGQYRLSMQTDGNAVVYVNGAAIWNSRSFSPGSTLAMQGDGNAVILSPAGRPTWDARTFGNAGATMVMQSDGNLVVYRANGRPAWNSFQDAGRIEVKPIPLPNRPHTLFSGSRLSAGSQLVSSNSYCRAVMQTDGNFVVYGPGGVYFQTRTGNGSYLESQTDGNVVLYTANRVPVFYTSTSAYLTTRLVMQDDCNLVLYRLDNQPIWDSNTATRAAATPPPVVTPPAPATPGNPGNTKNCSDFRTQAEAQAWFNTYYPRYGDVAQLDEDNDRIACETLR